MNIINSISFFIFGVIMGLLPVVEPALVAPSANSQAAAESTPRAICLIFLGYIFGAIGAWHLFKHMARGVMCLMLFLHNRAVAIQEA